MAKDIFDIKTVLNHQELDKDKMDAWYIKERMSKNNIKYKIENVITDWTQGDSDEFRYSSIFF